MLKIYILSILFLMLSLCKSSAQDSSPKKFDKTKFTIHSNNRDKKQSFKDNRHRKTEHRVDKFTNHIKEGRKGKGEFKRKERSGKAIDRHDQKAAVKEKREIKMEKRAANIEKNQRRMR